MTDQGGWQPYPGQPYPGQPYPGQPYPGQPYPGQPSYLPPAGTGWPPPGRPSVNGFAIAALVLGILPGAVLAVAFGVVALNQIGRRRQRGQAMAIVGIVLGSLWTILFVLAIIGSTLDESGNNGDPNALKPGDCTAYVPDTTLVFNLPTVPCEGPHRNEVFANLDLGGGDWPGGDALNTRAQRLCGERLDTIAETTAVPDDAVVVDLIPTEITWHAGNHSATCLVELTKDRSGRLLPDS
jgi:hypothetical protein